MVTPTKGTIGHLPVSETIEQSDLVEIQRGSESLSVPVSTLALAGADGKSAFELAQAAGFEGTEPEWLDSLKGQNGTIGTDGKTAFQIAAAAGFEGTESEWLASLKGEPGTIGTDGKTAFEIAASSGFEGTEAEWLASLNGKTAYAIAVELGFVGSEAEWLASLKGDRGDQGLKGDTGVGVTMIGSLEAEENLPDAAQAIEGASYLIDGHFWTKVGATWVDLGNIKGEQGFSAYELAVADGFLGTEAEWRESLRGLDGLGLRILGSFEDEIFLPAFDNSSGDAYIINSKMWVWEGAKWEPVGQVGPAGQSAFNAAKAAGQIAPSVTLTQWLDSLKGKSAYQIAKDLGQPNTSSEAVWLASLKGADGVDGDDAYLVAIAAGFVGDRTTWLASLKGDKGDQGIQGDQGVQGDKGDKGDTANSVVVKGKVATVEELPAADNVGGDAFYVGLDLYVWDGAVWFNAGSVKGDKGDTGLKGDTGAKGDKGDTGAAGKTAYQTALDNGFVGTAVEWLASLKGTNGTNGKTAFEIAVAAGFAGNEQLWLQSLAGKNGINAYEVALDDGFVGTVSDWLLTLKGAQGDRGSQGVKGDTGEGINILGTVANVEELPAGAILGDAYLLAEDLYIFNSTTWVNGGPVRGESAYALALQNGFVGTLSAWLQSLVGPRGEQGAQGDQGIQGLKGDKGEKGDKGDQGVQGDQGIQGDQGVQGDDGPMGPALKLIARLANTAALPASGELTDAYLIDSHYWVWTGTAFEDMGVLQGPKGDTGMTGDQGVKGDTGLKGDKGDTGLKGDTGDQGLQGERGIKGDQGLKGDKGDTGAKGDKGTQGVTGLSAYESAVAAGFVGTEAAWRLSLKGDKGDGLQIKGTVATVGELPPAPVEGDAYMVADHLYLYIGGVWKDAGSLKGVQGIQGKSAFDIAKQIDPALLNEAEWLLSLRGEKGDKGDQGLQGDQGIQGDKGDTGDTGVDGPMGPGIKILGKLATSAELPVEPGVLGEGYLIGLNFWGWTGAAYEDLGTVQGPQGIQGVKGDQGVQGDKGIKGDKGDKGDKGTRWIAMSGVPDSVTGVPNDYYINTDNNEYYLKVNLTVWASMGFLGGGTVNDSVHDGNYYVRVDGEWVVFPFGPIIEPGMYIATSEGWKQFDQYDVATFVHTGATLDVEGHQYFHVTVSAAVSIAVPNYPVAGRSKAIVLIAHGNTGGLTLTGRVNWGDAGAPTLGAGFTVITLLWDDVGTQWLASSGASGTNLA